VSEAAVCKVPFLAQRQVMPQEECVLEWLQRSRTGIVVDDFKALPLDFLEQVRACKEVLATDCQENRAVFEVSRFVSELVAETYLEK